MEQYFIINLNKLKEKVSRNTRRTNIKCNVTNWNKIKKYLTNIIAMILETRTIKSQEPISRNRKIRKNQRKYS